MSALRQAALEYTRQITDWSIIFTVGSRPNIYILGNFFNTMHSWRLGSYRCLDGLWFRVTCFPPQLPFRSGGACIFICIMSFWVLELLDCWVMDSVWVFGAISFKRFLLLLLCWLTAAFEELCKIVRYLQEFLWGIFPSTGKKLSSETTILFVCPFVVVVCWGWELSFLDEHF